jgi:hypothetical protein
MPGADHFDGHANLTQAQRRGSAPILAELLGASEDIRHVDLYSLVAPEHQDGSRGAPFSTIQAAVDSVASVYGTILIAPGLYPENVVVRNSIALFSTGGYESVLIKPAAGVPVTVTNATLESLATYRGSADYADLEYDPTLANGGGGPQDFVTSGMYFWAGDGTSNSLELLGVKGDASPTTTNFLDGNTDWYMGAWLNHTAFWTGLLMRNAGWFNSYFCQVFDVEAFNVPNISFRRTSVNDIASDYDAASAHGNSTASHGGLNFIQATVDDLTLTGDELFATSSKGNRSMTFGTITLSDASSLVARQVFADSIAAAADATFTLHDGHVSGDITLAAGAGACVMNGGEYMGTLGGAGAGRLTHNLGNIGT